VTAGVKRRQRQMLMLLLLMDVVGVHRLHIACRNNVRMDERSGCMAHEWIRTQRVVRWRRQQLEGRRRRQMPAAAGGCRTAAFSVARGRVGTAKFVENLPLFVV